LDEAHDYIDNLPEMEGPEIYGLHDNSEVSQMRKESKDFMSIVLSVQPKDVWKTSEAAKGVAGLETT
jgi:hypothetical protein